MQKGESGEEEECEEKPSVAELCFHIDKEESA